MLFEAFTRFGSRQGVARPLNPNPQSFPCVRRWDPGTGPNLLAPNPLTRARAPRRLRKVKEDQPGAAAMGHAVRVLGFLVFVAAVAGATYGAFQQYGSEVGFASVRLVAPAGAPPDVLAGATGTLTIGVENLGDDDLTVSIASATSGILFELQGGPVTVAPGDVVQVTGGLGVPEDARGALSLELTAEDVATGRKLDTLRFDVVAHEPLVGELHLTAFTPGVAPGARFDVKVTVVNPAPTPQRFTLSAQGAPVAFDPQQLNVGPNANASAYATVTTPLDVEGALEMVFEARGDSGLTASRPARLPVVPAGDAGAAALFDVVRVAPDGLFSVPVTIVSNLGVDAEVGIQVPGGIDSSIRTAPAGEVVGGFVTIRAPSEIPRQGGQLEMRVILGNASIRLPLTILPADGALASRGAQVQVDYVGRLTDGTVFDTSVEEVSRGPFPKAPAFRARLTGFDPIAFALDPDRATVIPGMIDGVTGLREGETRTLVITPEDGYGPPLLHVNVSRTTTVERRLEQPRAIDPLPIDQLPTGLEVRGRSVGEIVSLTQEVEGQTFTSRFEILAIDAQTVTLSWFAEVGEVATLYAPWPDMSHAVEVTEDVIVYETTPTVTGTFAWTERGNPHLGAWGATTRVLSVDETAIELSHDPPVGLAYELPRGDGTAIELRVLEVGPDEVHVVGPALSPLAGKVLVFDVWLRAVQGA